MTGVVDRTTMNIFFGKNNGCQTTRGFQFSSICIALYSVVALEQTVGAPVAVFRVAQLASYGGE